MCFPGKCLHLRNGSPLASWAGSLLAFAAVEDKRAWEKVCVVLTTATSFTQSSVHKLSSADNPSPHRGVHAEPPALISRKPRSPHPLIRNILGRAQRSFCEFPGKLEAWLEDGEYQEVLPRGDARGDGELVAARRRGAP